MTTTTKNNEPIILVTGATGTIGSEIIKQLASSSLLLQVFQLEQQAHSENKTDKLRSKNKAIEVVNMDYNKPEIIINAVRGVDKLWYPFTN